MERSNASMQYAIKTRDYINDYVWSWGNDNRDSPLAKVSLELQKQIEGGQKGIAVIFRNGSFHVIITGIYKLGDKPIGMDFSQTKIRLSLVFSGLSQPEVKGVIQYFFANQDNLGIGFEDIVSWTKDSWTINDEQLNLAFKLIPTCQTTGKSVYCDTGGLVSLSDFNFSEQTEGVKYVFQSNAAEYLKIDLEPIPKDEVPELTTSKDTKPKSSGKVFSILSILCLLCAVGFLGWKYIQLNEDLNTNNRGKIELNNNIKKLKEQISSLKSQNDGLKTEVKRFESENSGLVEKLKTKDGDLSDKDKKNKNLENELLTAQAKITVAEKDRDKEIEEKKILSIQNEKITQYVNNILAEWKIQQQNDCIDNLQNLKKFVNEYIGAKDKKIDELSNENSELKFNNESLQKQIKEFNSSGPRPTPADDVE